MSDYKGTFLDKTHIRPWHLTLFINHWLQKKWDHRTVMKCLGWSEHTTIDWRSFCSEVTMAWFKNQDSIGGDRVVVEVDETLFTKKKYERGRVLNQVWLFGGIEKFSQKKFIVPLTQGQDRSAKCVILLIKKYILPGSVIISDCWKAYSSLKDEG